MVRELLKPLRGASVPAQKVCFLAVIVFLPVHLIFAAPASAALEEFFSVTGKLFVSVDGGGSLGSASGGSSHVIEVEKPNATATVQRAFVLAASTGGRSRPIGDGEVDIAILTDLDPVDVVSINWGGVQVPGAFRSFNHRADITSFIKPFIDDAPPGRISFLFREIPTSEIDGEILVVIFDDPTQNQDSTIVLLFGQQTVTGDLFAITLAEPINPSTPPAFINMGLGISFSAQINGNQFSLVDVNGLRITSAAGGGDDGGSFDGALITVGGLDDSISNPPDPSAAANNNPRFDDELYSLLQAVNTNTQSISVNTINPSNDDNILFAYFNIATPAVVGTGILLTPMEATNQTGTSHTVTAMVVNDNGGRVPDTLVMFSVGSGPNSNESGTDVTDSNGEATFTYAGNGGEGTDMILASFINPQEETEDSNIVSKIWTEAPTASLSINFTGTGTGMTSADPPQADGGFNCFNNCTLSYSLVEPPTSVTLTPTPTVTNGLLSTFAGWSGCDSVSGNQCTVVMNSDKVVVATFNSDAPPVVTPPAPLAFTSPAGVSASDPRIQAFLNAATATDTIDGALTPTNNAPAIFPFGTTSVTFSATDSAGNTGEATAPVTITQDEAPVVTAPPLAFTSPAGVPASDPRIQAFLNAATVTDDIDTALTLTNNAPAIFPFGTTSVTFSATDSAGNTGEATAPVTITQDGFPVVTPPTSLVLTAPASVPASDPRIQTFLSTATALDEIDGALPLTNNAPAVFPFGPTPVIFTATDSAGNTSMATADVTVEPDPLAVIVLSDGADVNPGDQICETEFGNGVCTLRAAIEEANAQEGEQTITLPSGTYTLSIPGQNEDDAKTGDLDITDTLIITSSTGNAGDVIISGNGLDRVFDLPQGNPSVTIRGVTIQGGNIIGSTGGGIRKVAGGLAVENSVITSNQSDGSGGGISHLNGTLLMFETTVSNNISQGRGGGVQAQDGTVTISDSQFTGNQANFGGGLSTGNANVTVTDSTLTNNSAPGGGGGIYKFLHPGDLFGTLAPQVQLLGTTKLENNTTNDCEGFLRGDPSMVGNVGTPERCHLSTP